MFPDGLNAMHTMLPEGLEAMLTGPGRLRFVIQPIVALLLGFRDGKRDAKAGKPPYAISVLFEREARRDALVAGLKSVMMPLIVAIVLDLVLQYIIFRSVHLWHGVVAGALLIALPYVAARGFTNRLMQRRTR